MFYNRRSKRNFEKKPELSKEQRDVLRKEIVKKLNPMAIGLLVREASLGGNEWITSTHKAIEDTPEKISDKWISSINKWCQSKLKSLSATDPELETGKRLCFSNLIVDKVSEPNHNAAFPQWSFIAVDSGGWKYYIKTGKAENLKKGDIISFDATHKSSKEGISFLSRVSKLVSNGVKL